MGIQAAPEVKYQIIKDAMERDGACLDVSKLCRLAGVSRSGYYNWLNSEPKRQEREAADKADFEKVLAAYQYRGYAKGARSIYMRLLHEGIQMNLKKIRRLMRKFRLICPIRRPNLYKKMLKAMQSSHVAKNIVNRNFHKAPRKVLLTDITYMFYKGHNCCYLSTIIDAFTHEILAYELSDTLRVDFVLRTVDDLIAKYGCELDCETIIHSDQGVHYTSKAFIEKLRDEEFVQSMSRKGNCWDNAPQESFFGHMKDEIMYYVEKCASVDEVRARVDDWMDYYNNDRYQAELLKLSPVEYREYLRTDVYPLERFLGKPRPTA